MSSCVVIMNKLGVAVAADSAATVGSREAIFNTAQKIFPIGLAPISVSSYGSADVMGVPIDVLIKEYGSYIANKNKKNTVEEYGRGFLDFLVSESSYFNFKNAEQSLISSWIKKILKRLLFKIETKETKPDKETLIEGNYQKLIEFTQGEYESDVQNPINVSYVKDKFPNIFNDLFINYFSTYMNRSFKKNPINDFDKSIINKLTDIVEKITSRSFYYPRNTGICFMGYGEKQIYPSFFHFRFCFVVCLANIEINFNMSRKKLKYFLFSNVYAGFKMHFFLSILLKLCLI